MSAPFSGRQSPPPESQSGIQQQEPPASGKIGASTEHPAPEFAQQASDAQKESQLESNPEHPLEKIEAAKFRKGVGN